MSTDSKNIQEKLQRDIQRYFLQLTKGCGRVRCDNPKCASNMPKPLNSKEAIVESFQLAKEGNQSNLCRTVTDYFDLSSFKQLTEHVVNTKDYSPLIHKIGMIFSLPECLNVSFLKDPLVVDEPTLGLDLNAVREVIKIIAQIPEKSVLNSIINATERCATELKLMSTSINKPQGLRSIIILLEFPWTHEPSNHKSILFPVLSTINSLAKPSQDLLMRFWSNYSASEFQQLLANFQQFITFRIILPPYVSSVNRDDLIISASKSLQLLYNVNEVKNFVPYTEFYNDLINEKLDIREEFVNWKSGRGFSYCQTPYILNPQKKSMLLQFESVIEQQEHRQQAFRNLILGIGITSPYLGIRVRRENLIEDSLHELGGYTSSDLKKELRVKFDGEEAIDEGGVQKEWFQLVVREIFDPKYGMFIVNEETRTYWFNSSSTDWIEYQLIGMLLGLAIYNGVILDVHFPRFLYRKLVGHKATFSDLKETHPSVAIGLEKLMNYPGDADDFGLTFQVTYDVFGEKKTADLIENGENVPVTNDNKNEYVRLYSEWLLEESIKRQWEYFYHKGFKSLCDTPGFRLFRAEELELLICGSPELDFEALEKNTVYDNGYTKDHQTIKNFWSVVHSLTLEQKKKLLSFATGSDRAPIGGLANLQFAITRHGDDSDRLPSAHTCFNHLLLPEYSTKEKLKDRLLAAINNSEGFGML